MNQNLMRSGQLEGTEQEICEHYWVLEPAEGPTSQGTCRLCGVTEVFKNSMGSTWVVEADRREARAFEAASKRERDRVDREALIARVVHTGGWDE